MTIEDRKAVVKRFDTNLKNPNLTNCQKENLRLMWIEAKKLSDAVVNNHIEKGRYYITEGNGIQVGTAPPKIRKFRRWLDGWLKELFIEKYADPSTLKFRSFCSDNAEAPIRPFLSLSDSTAKNSKA
jgi:hypothetical protein